MKRLTDYAKEMGICYKTAWNWYKEGEIDTYISPSGSIFVKNIEHVNINKPQDYIVTYARVSSSQNKDNLETQSQRLINYSNAKGYNIKEEIKEIGSGINDNRQKLNKILKSKHITKIIIEHKDRLTRFGFNYIKILLNKNNIDVEVINEVDTNKDDLIQDFISIITSFCARIYGQRRNKRKTEFLINKLTKENNDKN